MDRLRCVMWSFVLNMLCCSSKHSQCRHQTVVNGKFHALATVPWGKATLCPQSRSTFSVPYHRAMLQPLISLCLTVLYKTPIHIRYSCNLYSSRKVQALCQNLKCRTAEVHFLKLH